MLIVANTLVWKLKIRKIRNIFCACSNITAERSRRSPKKEDTGSLLPQGETEETQAAAEEEEKQNGKPGRKIRKGELYLPEDYNKYEIPVEGNPIKTLLFAKQKQ